jgi:hypothetical protein
VSRDALVGAIALAAAALAAFLLTFAGLFADAPGGPLHPERLVSYALVAGAHFAVAAVAAHFGRARWPAWAVLVAAPSVAVAFLYAAREPTVVGYAALYAVLAAGAAAGGAWFAASRHCPVPRRAG